MTSNIKEYELVEQSQDRSETDVIAQGIPVQGKYPQFVHPQHQVQSYPQHQAHGFPQHQHPQMMPQQFIQQPMPQYAGGAPQYMGGAPQYQPMQLHQMNPMQLAAKHDEFDQEIRKHHHLVTVNWIMIALQVIGGIFGVIFLILAISSFEFLCDTANLITDGKFNTASTRQPNRPSFGSINSRANLNFDKKSCIEFLNAFGTPIILVFALCIGLTTCLFGYMHYRGIVAYRKRSAESMECMFICYAICLALNTIGMNCIGMGAYGYLTYAAHKLKASFAEMHRIESVMRIQGMNDAIPHSYHQPGMQVRMMPM